MKRREFLSRILGVSTVTTIYHDAIPVGAAANAETFNSPLGDLDEAINGLVAADVAIHSEIDALIIGSGTSDAETIAARSGYSILQKRIDDVNLVTDTFFVDAAFNGLGAAGRYTTISAALADCTGGETIHIAAGIYTGDVTVADNNVKLIGAGSPTYNSGTGRLVNGTIIRGRINLGATVGSVIRDLGVDLVGVLSKDGIGSTATTENVYRIFENLVIVGSGQAGGAHGMYVSGNYNTLHDCRVFSCYHGIAIHGAYTNLTNAYIYCCYSFSLVIKAKLGSPVRYVNVANVTIEGNPAGVRAGQLELQTADSTELDHINIVNVNVNYAINYAVEVQLGDGTGTISDITLTNVQSDNNRNLISRGDFYFSTGTRISLIGCKSTNRVGATGFYTTGTPDVSLIHCQADSSGSAALVGTFTQIQLNNNIGVPGTLSAGILKLTHGGTATIAAGVIAATASFLYVDTEAAAATDDLDTISGGSTGQIIILQSAVSTRDVTIKNGTGNIDCKADIVLDGNRDCIAFIFGNANHWERFGFGDNL